MFKLALDRMPSDEDLCSQLTISRLENLPDRRTLLRLGGALVEQHCASFRQVPAASPIAGRPTTPGPCAACAMISTSY